MKYAISAVATSALATLGIFWGANSAGGSSLLAGDILMYLVVLPFVLFVLGAIVFDVITIIRSYFLYGRDHGIKVEGVDHGFEIRGEDSDQPSSRPGKLLLYAVAVPLLVYAIAASARHIGAANGWL